MKKNYLTLLLIALAMLQNINLPAQDSSANPFLKIKPLAFRFQALPLSAITPGGWLKTELKRNLDGFTGRLDTLAPDLIQQDDIYGKDRLSKKVKNKNLGAVSDAGEWQAQFLWWNSETQSNWLDGFIRTAILLKDKTQLEKAERLINRLLQTQDKDGYIGIYDPELRYRFDNENGELWSKATLYRALLGWYDYKKDPALLTAIEKAVKNVMDNYPVNQSHPFYSVNPDAGGLTHGLAFTDVLEQLYVLTKKQAYLDYCLFLYKDFSTQTLNEDAQFKKLQQADLPLKGHGVHTYEHLRSVIAAWYASGNPALKPAIDQFIRKINRATTPSGAPVGDEFAGGRAGDATSTGYEFCSLHELMAGWISLLEKTGDPDYSDRAEKILFNAAAGATHPDQSAICYLKTDNTYILNGGKHGDTTDKHQTRYRYSPVHREAAVCCVPNAGRIGPWYIQHMWMKDQDGLVATLLGPSELNTTLNGKKVQITTVTGYPFDMDFRFRIYTTEGNRFSIKIRKPGWAIAVYTSTPFKEENGFLVFKKRWKQQDELIIRFEAAIQKNQTNGDEYYFQYGPLVLCHPLNSTEVITKTYTIAGLTDFNCLPLKETVVELNGALPVQDATVKNHFHAEIKPAGTDQPEVILLVPMAGTTLRQVTFKMKGQ